MTAQLIAWTVFQPPAEIDWNPTTDEIGYFDTGNGYINLHGGNELAEFAGRACYESWTRPNPKTATNDGYLANIIDVQHFSVLEHSSATFYLTGVSRSLTHELVRHRHLSYSQRSQRYVNEAQAVQVKPKVIADDSELSYMFDEATRHSQAAYTALVDGLMAQFDETQPFMTTVEKRKAARGAARSVMPNATETRIVVTGNMRSWREFLEKRGARGAEVEIRALAAEVYQIFNNRPDMKDFFSDFYRVEQRDGSVVVTNYREAGQ